MRCTWKRQVGEPGRFDMAKALNKWVIKDAPLSIVDCNGTMNGVANFHQNSRAPMCRDDTAEQRRGITASRYETHPRHR
jgi:hypothetical protein